MYNHLPIGSLRGQTGMPVGGSTWMGSFPVYGQGNSTPPSAVTRGDSITNPYGSRPGDRVESFSVTPLAQVPQQRQTSGGGGGMSWDKFGGNKLDTWNGRINGGRSPVPAPVLQGEFGKRNLDMRLPGFAEGGRPPLGRPVLVGERGPEVVQFDAAGPEVIPNDEAADYLSGGMSSLPGSLWQGARDMFSSYWPNFANGGNAPQPVAPMQYQQQPSAAMPLSGLTPYAPALAPLSQVSELFGGPSVFDNPARPMMSASPEPVQGPPAPAPVPQQNVPQGTNLRNAFTMQAPAQDDRVDSFGRFVPGAQTWARNLFQSAKAFPERKELAETAAQAAQWASMTKAQRLGALSAGERAVKKAERGNAMPVFSQNPDDAALERDLLGQLNQFNRTGNLPGASVQQVPTGGRNLVSPYGTGYSTDSASPGGGIFRMSPSTYGTMADVRADDAAREPTRRAQWQNRQDNFRRQMLGLR